MFFRWLGRLAAFCHDLAEDEDAEDDDDDAGERDDKRGAPVQFVVEGVDDPWAIANHEDGEDKEADEFAAEHGGGKEDRLHFKYACRELNHLKGKWRRNHGRDGDGEKLLFLEAVA